MVDLVQVQDPTDLHIAAAAEAVAETVAPVTRVLLVGKEVQA